MGTDIYLFVETRLGHSSVPNFGGEFVDSARFVEFNSSVPEQDWDIVLPSANFSLWTSIDDSMCWDIGRNYDLFGRLAGVRNRFVAPISPPRGVPGDLSSTVQQDFDNQAEWAHSHSWFLLSELDRYAWNEYPIWQKFLGEIRKLGSPEYIRTVFWFD